jgi:hypothetical protein
VLSNEHPYRDRVPLINPSANVQQSDILSSCGLSSG